ncbi:MAG TPA: hypothetical protein VL418_05990 [Devosiaceae bacterium]|jgi:hypothetical protein|nr:hypothetical protein [Devosiaceae bacterium]
MKKIICAALLLAGLAMPAWADPSGTYSVKGTNPGDGSSYDGTVKISKSGDTFKVVWTINGDTSTGTAVGNDDLLSIGYSSGDKPGVGLYVKEEGKWKGIWSYLGQTDLGTEVWTQ